MDKIMLGINELYFAKLREDAKIPTKDVENAGYDIYACFDEDYIELDPHETKMIPTGIISAFSDDFVMILKERGSTGTKGIAQRCGVIDSGFRGEWLVPINNTGDKTIIITKDIKTTRQFIAERNAEFSHGNVEIALETLDDNYIFYPYEKAISQALLLPVPKVEIIEISAEELKAIPSKRGDKMLGSTNK